LTDFYCEVNELLDDLGGFYALIGVGFDGFFEELFKVAGLDEILFLAKTILSASRRHSCNPLS
jgi:hypothetical protein